MLPWGALPGGLERRVPHQASRIDCWLAGRAKGAFPNRPFADVGGIVLPSKRAVMPPSWPETHAVLGPLFGILPRVVVVLLSVLAALAAAAVCGRAAGRGKGFLFSAAWVAGTALVVAGFLGFASQAVVGLPVPEHELLKWARFAYVAQGHWRVVAMVLGIALVAPVVLRRKHHASAADAFAGDRHDHAWAVGEAGEVLVAGIASDLRLPALHNLVLGPPGHSVEIDHVVRTPGAIVVLETKTFGGTVAGRSDAETWTQRTRGAVRHFYNPLRQNLGHVRAVEAFLGDDCVPVRGHVVSAGGARFAPSIAGAIVPLEALLRFLSAGARAARHESRAFDRAWARLEAAAAQSDARRAAHASCVRSRRRVSAAGT